MSRPTLTYDEELGRTADRLRQLSEVRLSNGEDRVRSVLEAMTERPVPRLEPRAWGDQLVVIGREVPMAERDAFCQVLIDLRRSFDITPGG